MAQSNIKKNASGYGYKYTDLAEIHNYLESIGASYYQWTETDSAGVDYIWTTPIIDGQEQPPRRGCRVIQASLSGKSNPAQEQGSGLTYARRYSLLMAFGLATTDDDAACFTREEVKTTQNESKALLKTLETALKGTGFSVSAVCGKYGKNNLADLTAEEMAEAIQICKKHHKEDKNK